MLRRALASGPRSLRARILWRVLLPLAATWAIGSIGALVQSWALAGKAYDRALLGDAYALASNVTDAAGTVALTLTEREVDHLLFDLDEQQYFVLFDDAGRVIAGDPALPRPADQGALPYEFFDGRLGGRELRLAALRGASSRRFTVVVGRTTSGRSALLRDLFERSVLPQVLLLLLLGAVLWRQISRELEPLGRLQRELDRRGSSDLDPVALRPISADVERLRDSVNALLVRIGQGVQAQREFAGNVAHDLRTPLAGIRALAEYGLAQPDPEVWRRQLQSIAASEERASHFVAQLLALALADEARDSTRLEPVQVDRLVRRVVLGFLPRADAARVDLGAVGLDVPTLALASPALLEGVLTNLIDNALRYGRGAPTPTLTIEVAAVGDEVRVTVVDNGPGLEAGEGDTLSRRWTQGSAGRRLGAGSGLGLAIVARYATLMKARLAFERGVGGLGLRAVVSLRRDDTA